MSYNIRIEDVGEVVDRKLVTGLLGAGQIRPANGKVIEESRYRGFFNLKEFYFYGFIST
ncbi:MAG: hypothetical protein OIN85_10045 [Candidatus Methanoperedens sp.]|nr:hypothetical protein [Candidatus Methanoperedens sp.]